MSVPPPRAYGAAPARILLAEDDPNSAAVLQAVLQHAGYVVALAEDGASALHLLEAGEVPDLLLLDWMLPGVSGLEICHRARRRWDPLALPILMVTARVDAESISAAFDAGASDYITKPFLGMELRARVAAHLRTKRLIEERQRIDEHLREREKLSALGLLASGVAHDLNTPLASISGYAQLLLRQPRNAADAQDLRVILTEVERCQRIAGRLLDFIRRRPPSRAPVKLNAVLGETFGMRERALRAAGIRAELRIRAPLPSLSGDAYQLQEVFLNVLLNAEHALKQGGGTLRIQADSSDDGQREWATVEFHNDAPPIPADVLPHIWEPFFTTKTEEEGTGLGLAICRRIVQEHGGTMDAESGPGGTVFRIRLPAASDA